MFKILKKGCEPTKGSKYSAAIDLYSAEDVVIGTGETVKVPLGVCIDENYLLMMIENKIDGMTREQQKVNFMKDHYLQLEPRSSLRAKGLIAGTGIIDLDYKDEIMIILHNPITFKAIVKWIFSFGRNKSVFKISKGEKIAQILLKEHKTYLMGIDTDDVRNGGFGSTDK
jgi:dUTPase